MNLTLIFLIGAIIYGVILLLGIFFEKVAPRVQYLEKMSKFLEGTLETIETRPNSYRVRFMYEGYPFEFEDYEDAGFQFKSFKGFLKCKTQSQLTMRFIEKERGAVKVEFRAGIDIPREAKPMSQVEIPQGLREFEVYTNNHRRTNQLLSDDKIRGIFISFKNIARRGYPIMALDVREGTVVLRFYHAGGLAPRLFDLKNSVESIEDYVQKVSVLVEAINLLEELEKS